MLYYVFTLDLIFLLALIDLELSFFYLCPKCRD